jgi:hypothetical protein
LAVLSGHGYEAKVADRGSVRLGVAIDHDHTQSAPGSGQGRGEAYDAGAYNG